MFYDRKAYDNNQNNTDNADNETDTSPTPSAPKSSRYDGGNKHAVTLDRKTVSIVSMSKRKNMATFNICGGY